MNTAHRYLLTLFTAITLSLPAAASAVQPGGYLGFGIGSADDELLQETDTAAKFFGGFNITRHIGFELSYVNLGEYVNGAIEQDGIAYELVGYLPLNYNVDLFGKVGTFSWEVSSGPFYVQGTDLTYGAGINVILNPHVNLRGEWQTFTEVDGGDVDLYSAGVSFHF